MLLSLVLPVNFFQNKIVRWNGPVLTQPRDQLSVEQLQGDSIPELPDMSYYSRPEWAGEAKHSLSGSVSFQDEAESRVVVLPGLALKE